MSVISLARKRALQATAVGEIAQNANVWITVALPIAAAVLGGSAVAELFKHLLARKSLTVKEEFDDRARIKQSEAARRGRLESAHSTAASEHSDSVARVYG